MVEARILPEEKTSSVSIASEAEKRPQDIDNRLKIITTETLGADCNELSRRLGCDTGKVVNEILRVGYKTVRALVDGNKRVMVSFKDGKIVVENFRDLQS